MSGNALPLALGLERECGLVSRFETLANPAARIKPPKSMALPKLKKTTR